MRICLQLLVLVLVVFCLAEAKKKHKWMKKSKFVDYHHGKRNDLAKHGEDIDTDYHHPHHKKYKNKGRGEKHMGHHGYGGSMKHHKKGKFGHKKHMAWLNIRKDSDCGLTCKHGEVCITGPIDTKPLCVHKKDLKKSLKLFRRYQKKEMKAWSKFRKERYHHDDTNYPHKSEKLRKEDSLAALKKQYLAKHHHGKTEMKHELKPLAPARPDAHEECATSQFSQMRTRMMGWFHLLHAQDHLAKKAHEKHTKHFYKHVSVKKELREHDGNKCECLKSAMWQFHQMDKNSDDHLNAEEIAVLGENNQEPCLKPYLTSCDHNADGKFSSNEWCCCFSNVVAPCFKKVDEIRRSGEPVVYMPRCDKEGYYMREQCSGDSEDTYKCWCVDYNGNEYKGTYTHGRAHCHKIAIYGAERAPVV